MSAHARFHLVRAEAAPDGPKSSSLIAERHVAENGEPAPSEKSEMNSSSSNCRSCASISIAESDRPNDATERP